MDCSRNTIVMVNNVQLKIEHLSSEMKELSALLHIEKEKAESIMQKTESSSYDEDSLINLVNRYQYTIDELKFVCEHLYEASVQYKSILEESENIKRMYSEAESRLIYNGEINQVYSRLCHTRGHWNGIYHLDSSDRKKVEFKEACECFESWTKEVFDYTEHLGKKYNLLPQEVKIGGDKMRDLGTYNPKNGRISYNRRLIKDPEHTLITVIHEICHVRHPNHGPEFWHLYEDICIKEGLLLKRVLGNKQSLRELKMEDIPYRWKPQIDYFTSNEQLTIEKYLRIYSNGCRSFNYTPNANSEGYTINVNL